MIVVTDTNTTLTAQKKELVEAVKSQAYVWYDKGWCWDYVVEALDDREIAEFIGNAKTEKGAIKAVFERFVRPLQIQKSNCFA